MQTRLVSLVLVLAASTLSAQSFTPVRELKNLSPAALAKLHTLETLNALPAGDWRLHVGDLPHGESPTLDDSSWPLAADRAAKPPRTPSGIAATIEVPKTLNGYDITGSRIWFQFRADANGPMPEIIYFNGRRVALGDDLEPIILFEPAKPGDKILVAVKLLHTVDDKTFAGVNLRIEPNPDAPLDAAPTPTTSASSASPPPTSCPRSPRRAPTSCPRSKQPSPPSTSRPSPPAIKPPSTPRSAKPRASSRSSTPSSQQANIDLAGNAHIDAAWLWPRTETIDVVNRTFTTALQLMNEYPDYTYTQSAAQYNEWMADKYPDLNDQISQRIKEGRWEIVGGMWVEPDLNLPGGESLVRQLLVGQRYFQQQYGVTARIGWNPDSFGYNWQLPQIYKRSGLDYFVTQKMHWNDTNQLPFRLFWWESPDGSKVLTYFPTDYVHDNVNPTRISADFAESAQRNPGTIEHARPLRHRRPRRRPHPRHARPGRPLDRRRQPSRHRRPHHALRHRAKHYFTDVETNLNPNSPTWNYDSHRQGLHRTARRPQRRRRHPHLERRALLRVPPRRLHHPGRAQAQHAHQRNRHAQRRKASLPRMARRPTLS